MHASRPWLSPLACALLASLWTLSNDAGACGRYGHGPNAERHHAGGGHLQHHLRMHPPAPYARADDPGLSTAAGQSFSATCAQCHALPDPGQHRAQDWPMVVARMQRNMALMGRGAPDRATLDAIVAFLQERGR